MNWKCLVCFVLAVPLIKAAEPDALQGVWVFDSAVCNKGDKLNMVWESRITIAGDSFRMNGFLGVKAPLKGTLKIDATTEPKRFDLVLEELDLSETGMSFKIPAGVVPGIFKMDGDRIRVRFLAEVGGKRPAGFDETNIKFVDAVLEKAPADFKKFPAEVAIKVVGNDGKPVSGTLVGAHMGKAMKFPRDGLSEEQKKALDEQEKLPPGAVQDTESGWILYDAKTTDAVGKVTIKYEDCPSVVIARDAASKRMALAKISPAAALSKEIVAELAPECLVTVKATCEEFTKAKVKDEEFFNSYLETSDGRRICYAGSRDGKLEYLVPAGEYSLDVYGGAMIGKKQATISVPKDRSAYDAPPVLLPPTALLALLGKPAPEFSEVVGWKGTPVKLADLKGQYVMLEFWGYWCGPCVESMPVLFELHEKYAGKGLAIIGIHLDGDGEVATAAALDEKTEVYRKSIWKGKDLPFSVALVSGKRDGDSDDSSRGGLAAKYGIKSYPSTVLIDREGKVVGQLAARDAKDAIKTVEDLLKAEKK